MSAEELMSLADLSALQKVLHSRAAWTCHRVLFLLDGLLDAAPAELNIPDVAAIDGIVSSLDGCFPRGTWACKPVKETDKKCANNNMFDVHICILVMWSVVIITAVHVTGSRAMSIEGCTCFQKLLCQAIWKVAWDFRGICCQVIWQ